MSFDLRPELLPLKHDAQWIERLATLAAQIDGARPGEWEDHLPEFNRLAGTQLEFHDFQGIYGAEEHIEWVRRMVNGKSVRPVADVTREELIEVVRRAMPQNGHPDAEAYLAIFDANVSRPKASNLIFYPADYDPDTNTWGGGRPMGEYDPTPEEIVDSALA